jgi:hypothetical protein
MRKLSIAAALAAVSLMGSATALASNGHGGESPKGQHGQNQAGHGKSHRCLKTHRVGFVLHGTFAGFDAASGDVTVDVVAANRHARRYLDGATTYTFGSTGLDAPKASFEGLADVNADGVVGFDDAATTNEVVVIGKLRTTKRGCPTSDAVAPPTIRKVKVHAPASSGEESPATV